VVPLLVLIPALGASPDKLLTALAIAGLKAAVLVGLLLMVLGVGFLLEQLDFFFIPHWLFSFPMAMIVWGLYIGAKHNFRNSAWFIVTLIGLVWISNDIAPGYNLHAIMWPVAIIAFGIWLIIVIFKPFVEDAAEW